MSCKTVFKAIHWVLDKRRKPHKFLSPWSYPPALSDGGKLYLGNKIDLLACLLDWSEYQSDAVVMITIITDGAVIVHMLKLAVVKNFEWWICFSDSFHTLIIQFENVIHTDLVWNRYIIIHGEHSEKHSYNKTWQRKAQRWCFWDSYPWELTKNSSCRLQ